MGRAQRHACATATTRSCASTSITPAPRRSSRSTTTTACCSSSSTGIRSATATGRSRPACSTSRGSRRSRPRSASSSRRPISSPRDWEPLVSVFTTPGGNDEVVHLFLARGLSPVGHAHAREAEEADIRIEWIPLTDAVTGVLEGRLRNGILAIGVLAAAERAAPARAGGRGRLTCGSIGRWTRTCGTSRSSADCPTTPSPPTGATSPATSRGSRRTASRDSSDVTAALVAAFAAERASAQPPLAASSLARLQSSVRGLHRFLAREGIEPARPDRRGCARRSRRSDCRRR